MSQKATHYIDGKWCGSSGAAIASIDPATGNVVWEGPSATEHEVTEAIAAARKAHPKWAAAPVQERVDALHRYHEELQLHKEQLAEVISKEVGKPYWESLTEVQAMLNKISISIDAYNKRTGEVIHQGGALTSITRHKAHGVVAVFGPYNFPGHLPNGHIIPALLAGNCVVLKPSEHAPHVAEIMLQCWERANIPNGIINMVQGGRETGRLLAAHRDIDGLFFTGSWQTGRHFMETFVNHPNKILALEMGGNNPLVIWEAKNLAASAYHTILSAYITSGQRCTCARRLILPEGDQGDKFLNLLQEMAATLRVAAYNDKPDPFMGPVISDTAARHLVEKQQALLDRGAKALITMHHMKKGTGFVSPGLIDVTAVENREDEELFGPLLQVVRVNSFEEALVEANNTEYGLSAGLISNRPDLWEQFRHTIRAGIVNWNTQLTGASSAAPFGGVGKSGNYRPSAYYAADYCSYPVASMESESISIPEATLPGMNIMRFT